RAGVLPLSRRRPARVPEGGLPRAPGRVLHRRWLQERRRHRAPHRRGAHRPLPRGGHQSRGDQRRGREGSVGVPDLRQGLEAGRRRALDRAVPPDAPVRELLRGHQLALQAARRRARLERLRAAHELLHGVHARGRRRGVLHVADAGLRRVQARSHRGVRAGQPPAPHRSARDAVDRQVQLRRRRPRRVRSRSAQLRQGRLPRLPRGPAAELARRPVPHRGPDPPDDRDGADVHRGGSGGIAGLQIRALDAADWPSVAETYQEGIATGDATFEIGVPAWERWDAAHPSLRLVAEEEGAVLGWAALSPYSDRGCYRGVAEESVYVGAAARGRGVGRALLGELIAQAEAAGYWTLLAGVFPENEASLALH